MIISTIDLFLKKTIINEGDAMIYQIPIKKITSLVDNLTNINEEKTIEFINNAMFFDETKPNQKFTKELKIAQNYFYQNDIVVKVEILDNKILIDEENMLKLYALKMSKDKSIINIDLKSNKKSAKSILKLELNEENVDFEYVEKELEVVNWKIRDEIRLGNWNNPDYVLSFINNQTVLAAFKNIPKEFFENEDNVIGLVSRLDLENEEIKDLLLSHLKMNIGFLKSINRTNAYLLDDYKKEFKEYINSNKTKNQEMKIIEEKINDVNFALHIKSEDYFDVYFSSISEETLTQEKFIKESFESWNGLTEKDFFVKRLNSLSDETKEKIFFIAYPYMESYRIEKILGLISHIYLSEDNNKINEFINKSKISPNVVGYVVTKIIKEKKIPKDVDGFIDIFKFKNPEKLLQLAEKHITEENIIKVLPYLYDKRSEFKLTANQLKRVKNKEVIQTLISFSKKSDLIEAYGLDFLLEKENLNFLMKNKTHIDSKIEKKIISAIEKESSLIESYIALGNYDHLTEKVAKTKFAILEEIKFICNKKTDNYIENTIRYKMSLVVQDKDFLLSVIKASKGLSIGLIDEKIFNNKDFILEVFKLVDEGFIDKQNLKKLPYEINDYLQTLEVKKDYVEAFNMFLLYNELQEKKEKENKIAIKKNKI